jgi:DNA polymerase-3 subunit epsilon
VFTSPPVTVHGASGDGLTMTGFVLLLDDITASFETQGRRDALIQSLTEGSRGPLGNIRAASEMLASYPDMDADERGRFLKVIGSEVEGLSGRVEQAAREYARELTARWPLEEMRGADLVAVAIPRISERCGLPVKAEEVDEGVWMKVDSFSFLQVLCYLTSRLRDEYDISEVRLALSSDADHACLDLIWLGTSMSTETVMNWEMDSMRSAGEGNPLVGARSHGSLQWRDLVSAQARFAPGGLPFLLPLAAAPKQSEGNQAAARGSRPEFYDFDLFSWSERSHALDDRLLSDLAFTVFDTETTGLEPSAGDEIIQIGATRIVNRRLLTHEVFDQLIDPERHLPEASVKIHGITPEMLVGQPTIGTVLPAFRSFCADTVLVAHNAAFDMRFLQIKEATTESNSICRSSIRCCFLRYCIRIRSRIALRRLPNVWGYSSLAAIRHWAMPMSTGEVFLKMVPLLAEMGRPYAG